MLFLSERNLSGEDIHPLGAEKHNTDPRAGILHLDCTFMPVGKGHAIIYKDGFMYPQDYHTLLDLFGRENVFEITREEMYYMNTNVFPSLLRWWFLKRTLSA